MKKILENKSQNAKGKRLSSVPKAEKRYSKGTVTLKNTVYKDFSPPQPRLNQGVAKIIRKF